MSGEVQKNIVADTMLVCENCERIYYARFMPVNSQKRLEEEMELAGWQKKRKHWYSLLRSWFCPICCTPTIR